MAIPSQYERVIEEDFEDQQIEGWNGDTGSFELVNTSSLGGNYWARLNGSPTLEVSYPFDNPSEFGYTLLVYTGDTVSDFWATIADNGEIYSRVFFDVDGEVNVWTPSGIVDNVASWSSYTTYQLDFIFEDGTVDIYLDGSPIHTGADAGTSGTPGTYEHTFFDSSDSSDIYGVDNVGYITVTPPSAPSSLSASPVDGDQIDLSWGDNSDNEDGFRIYRAQASGSSLSDYSQIDTVGANTTSYSDAGLEDGERYFYRVTAYNAGGESDPTNEADATTNLPATTPSLDAATEGEITVSWSKEDDSSDGEWELYRSQDGSLGSLIADGLSPSTSSYTDTGLEDGEEYYYTLRRRTTHRTADGGQQSAVTVLPAPALDALDLSVEGEVTLTWTKNDNNSGGGYEIWRATQSGVRSNGSIIAQVDETATSYTDGGLNDGERYWYMVVRTTTDDDTVDGSLTAHSDSNESDGVTVLPAPTSLSSPAHTATSIDLSWSASHNYGNTRVEFRPSDESSWTTDQTVSRTTESATVDGLRNGEEYGLRVVAETEHTSTEDA